MKRSYAKYLDQYKSRKMILITGPRQSGKTTLSKQLLGAYDYLNFDHEESRKDIKKAIWDRNKDYIILDEIHKMKQWKRWLKGVYDTEGLPPGIVVTGSARLDTFRKVGDSLAGRYFQYRIHPFDVRELHQLNYDMSKNDVVKHLMQFGGFPEPFLEQDIAFYNMWKNTHLDIILKQDLMFQEDIRDFKGLMMLINLLKDRVGSPISYNSIAEDLQINDKTVKRWLNILEDMYVIFKIVPFHKNIARANQKKPKYYFFDLPRVNDLGARLENLVACSLLKECQFRNDCLGEEWSLHYIAKRGGKEIDFLICNKDKPEYLVEVKNKQDTPSPNFKLFEKDLPDVKKIQLVNELKKEKSYPNGIEIRHLADWLCQW